MNETRNYILAITLSLAVVFGWQILIANPKLEQAQRQAEIQAKLAAEQAGSSAATNLPAVQSGGLSQSVDGAAPATSPALGTSATPVATQDRASTLAQTSRVSIKTDKLSGSINLTGARIDDLKLNDYRVTLADDSPTVTLFSPNGAPAAFYAEQGWIASGDEKPTLPDASTLWQVAGNTVLTTQTPIVLTYDNGAGLSFKRTISLDDNYMFTIAQQVTNQSSGATTLFPYSLIARNGIPEVQNFFILHEGLIGFLDEELVELKYKKIIDENISDHESTGGWLGMTDKYWAAAIIPDQTIPVKARFSHVNLGLQDEFQTSFLNHDGLALAQGGTVSSTSHLFAGAKVESIIDSYETNLGITKFELMIDWGWFHFITKPLFKFIRLLHSYLGNFGLVILAVTVIIKAFFFPLANKSYKSMARMKVVQPQLKEIQAKFKDDRAKLQAATMELYKKEKINPVAGCWPVMIQIPVFFSLYKVLFITIEMRHAPFFGWIQDMAAPDPTSMFNLFGLLPYDVPSFLMIGVWPLVMGITMFVQMRLNPPPPDPTQAMVFGLMPIFFTFLLAKFPAGLVIYWAWNNFLSILQQYTIMRRAGADVDLFGNIMSAFDFLKRSKD